MRVFSVCLMLFLVGVQSQEVFNPEKFPICDGVYKQGSIVVPKAPNPEIIIAGISQADIFDALPVTKPHFIPEALRKIFAILLCGSNIILIKENKPSPPCMELCQGFLSMLPPSISGHLASLDCSLLPSITNGTCSMQNDFNVTVSKVSINTDCFKAENYPNLGGKMCSGVLTGDFYVQTHIGHSVPILDGVIANGFAGLLPLSSPHFVRPSCRQAIANLFCNRVFPSCQKNTLLETAIGFPVPPLVSLPCPSNCNKVKQECGDLLVAKPELAAAINCDEFQNVYTFGKPPFEIIANCNNNDNKPETNLDCPNPLVIPDDPTDPATPWVPTTGCAVMCPVPVFTIEDINSMDTLKKVCSIISLIFCVFVLVTELLFPVKRKNTRFVCISVCSLFGAIGLLSGGDTPNLICRNNCVLKTQSDGGLCLTQAIFLVYVVMAANLWWMITSFDLYIMLTRKIKSTKKYEKYYNAVAWGFPLITLILSLSTGSLGANYAPWCTFQSDKWEAELFFYYIFVAICLVLGIYFTFHVIMRIIKDTYVSTGSTNSWTRVKQRLRRMWKLMIYIMLFVLVFFWLFLYRMLNRGMQNKFQSSLTRFIQCKLQNYGTPAIDECVNEHSPSVAALKSIIVLVAGQGVLLFIIFEALDQSWKLWWNLLRGLGLGRVDDDSSKASTAAMTTTAATQEIPNVETHNPVSAK